jgi:hypothetical protein
MDLYVYLPGRERAVDGPDRYGCSRGLVDAEFVELARSVGISVFF